MGRKVAIYERERQSKTKGGETITDQSLQKRLFALFYAGLKNPKEAALKVGFSEEEAEKKGRELLSSKAVRRMVRRFSSDGLSGEESVIVGLTRLAFGEVNALCEVILSDDASAHDLKRLNLFNVSEIKKVKGGGVEVKLFDRQKALEKLLEIYEKSRSELTAEQFLSGLDEAAKASEDG